MALSKAPLLAHQDGKKSKNQQPLFRKMHHPACTRFGIAALGAAATRHYFQPYQTPVHN
jgi:hypothetical protein